MPFINIKTNESITKDTEISLKAAFGQAITAIPGKSEDWLMVGIEPDYALYFKGSDAPAAMVEIAIFGKASSDAYDALTKQICSAVTTHLNIPANRTYVKYTEIDHWGWNNMNF